MGNFVLNRELFRETGEGAVNYFNSISISNMYGGYYGEDIPDNRVKYTTEHIDILENLILNCSAMWSEDAEINNILIEEMPSYFSGQKELDKVNDYLLDDKFSKYASIILDSELKAASDEYALFMFDSINMSNDFNYMFNELEYFLGNIFDKTYKVISVDKKSWEIIKKEFNGKTKEFIYKEEPEELLKKLSNNNDTISELDQIFGNIVKYE